MRKVSALLLIGLLAAVGLVSAFRFGNPESGEAVRQAIEAGDYNAWKEAMTAQLTEENFNRLAERHQEMEMHGEAIDAALEAEDYGAFVEALENSPHEQKLAEKITEENFDSFIEMHNARQDGDYETANAIAEELGFGKGCRGGFKGGMH